MIISRSRSLRKFTADSILYDLNRMGQLGQQRFRDADPLRIERPQASWLADLLGVRENLCVAVLPRLKPLDSATILVTRQEARHKRAYGVVI